MKSYSTFFQIIKKKKEELENPSKISYDINFNQDKETGKYSYSPTFSFNYILTFT